MGIFGTPVLSGSVMTPEIVPKVFDCEKAQAEK